MLKTTPGQRKAMYETFQEAKPGDPDWITAETLAPMIMGDLMKALEMLAEVKDHLHGCGRRDLHREMGKRIKELLGEE